MCLTFDDELDRITKHTLRTFKNLCFKICDLVIGEWHRVTSHLGCYNESQRCHMT